MRKLDKLILKAFIGPLIVTFLVSVFILVTQYMLKYFDDFIGKDLGAEVFAELLFYFSINMSPVALPLGILISALMTYGKLGEHFELTAIKSVGISLVRTLYPTFILVCVISVGAYFLANDLVPFANLRAYSLLYDIKHKKPSLDLREGQFYAGIPNVSMKVNRKFDDGVGLEGLIIYDHKNVNGNKKIIMADSGRMYTFINDRYLMLELYDGNHAVEKQEKKRGKRNNIEQLTRTEFESMKLVYSLASFDLDRTDLELFAGNRKMKTSEEITSSVDSMMLSSANVKVRLFNAVASYYKNHLTSDLTPSEMLIETKKALDEKKSIRDSLKLIELNEQKAREELEVPDSVSNSITELDSLSNPYGKMDSLTSKVAKKDSIESVKPVRKPKVHSRPPVKSMNKRNFLVENSTVKLKKKLTKSDTLYLEDSLVIETLRQKIDSVNSKGTKNTFLSRATSFARNIKSSVNSADSRLTLMTEEIDAHEIEKYKKYAIAFSCIVLFLIGAPLGAIIKKGGLGVPIIVAVFFFIIFYVMMIISEKWAKAGTMDPLAAAWMANIVLIPFGVFFLRQARLDARVFDTDIYLIWIDKLTVWWKKKIKKKNG